ncbi:MAG: polyprenyl synthetase family protein [Oscillospiraceae bacterium]|nr:polyprenyl synthetase family protein [Oscillospiraceae bacterium]
MASKELLSFYAPRIEQALESCIPSSGLAQQTVADAMRYSLLGGGKRLRGALLLEFCRVSGGDWEKAMPFACAIEMIHAYSLIHDDLPCMDDDDMRRGKPSCHKAFGEGMAVLAGDGLLTLAFETALRPENLRDFASSALYAAAGELARGAGLYGMLGGQCIDVENDGHLPSASALEEMCAMKTGALIRAACLAGCRLAGADETMCEAAEKYASALGLAFQIRDDMLDRIGDEKTLGKATGADEKQHKTTFAGLYGLDRCREMVHDLTLQAEKALACFEDRDGLLALARQMESRMY